jgi:hypothetical protein
MIKHIVMWKIKEFAEGNDKETNIAIAKEKLTVVVNKLPQVKFFEFGRCIRSGEMCFDVALVMEFETEEDLQSYLQDPDHKAVSAFVSKIREERAVVDYII